MGEPSPEARPVAHWRRAMALAFAPVFVLLAARLFLLVDEFAVNVLFLDQWDYFTGLFEDRGLLELFRWQHGPHRQGLGYLVTKALAEASGWDMRIETFGIWVILCIACGLALWLKHRIVGEFHWSDAAIPLMVLSTQQFETLFNTPNPAHSALPLALLMALGLAWTIPSLAVRLVTIVLLDVCLVYTGFGLFAGAVIPPLLGLEVWGAARRGERVEAQATSAALLLSLLILGSFFVDFTFNPAFSEFQFPHPEWRNYPRFMAIAAARPLFLPRALAEPAGALLIGVGGWVVYLHARRLVREPHAARNRRAHSLAAILLVGYALVFFVNLAIGRIWLGVSAGMASRYVTLASTLYLGLHLHLSSSSLSRTWRLRWLGVSLAIFLWASGYVHAETRDNIRWFHQIKATWKQTYLATGSIGEADTAAGYKLYPRPAATHMAHKLAFVRERELNLFSR